jgi:hypothetical protein
MRGKPKYNKFKKILILIYEIICIIWFHLTLIPFIFMTGYCYFIDDRIIQKNVKYGIKIRYLMDIYPSKSSIIVVIFLHGGMDVYFILLYFIF